MLVVLRCFDLYTVGLTVSMLTAIIAELQVSPEC